MVWIPRIIRWVKVAVWAAFLAVFPVMAVANGMYAGAAILAVLGLLLDATEVGGLLPERAPALLRRALVAALVVLHVGVGAFAVGRLLYPHYGAWERLAGTESWNNSRVLRASDGPLLALGSGALFALGDTTTPIDGIAPPVQFLGAGQSRVWFVDAEFETAFGYDGDTVTTVPLGESLAERSRGAILGPRGAALDEVLFAVVRNSLLRIGTDGEPIVAIGGPGVSSVATLGDRVVAVGKRLYVSEDRGLHFAEREPLELRSPEVFLGGDTIYVVQGGMLASTLLVSESDGPLEPRYLPVRDARMLVVDPVDGQRVWVGSWGEGVWRSEDAGRTWEDLDLEGLEIGAMVVAFGPDRDREEAWVAASNLAIPSGIYHYPGP